MGEGDGKGRAQLARSGTRSVSAAEPVEEDEDDYDDENDGGDRDDGPPEEPKKEEVEVEAKRQDIRAEERVYLTWVKSQLDSESACMEFPFTMLLLLSFTAVFVLHSRPDKVFSVETAIESDILAQTGQAFEMASGSKGLEEMRSFADFWSWARLGLLPLISAPAWTPSERFEADAARLRGTTPAPTSSPRPTPVAGEYLRYNRLIGGLRFRQQVAQFSADGCRFPNSAGDDVWAKWYGKPCAPAWEDIHFDPTSEDTEQFRSPQRVEWMLTPIMSAQDMTAMAVDMEDGCAQMEAKGRACLCTWCGQQSPPSPWLREDTQRVEISMATYNAEYGLITLTGCNLFFTRGGTIRKHFQMASAWADVFGGTLSYVFGTAIMDLLWVGLLIYMVVTELREIVAVIRSGHGPHWWNSLFDDYLYFFRLVDWAIVIVGAVIVTAFAQRFTAGITLQAAFKALLDAEASKMSGGREAYLSQVVTFYDAMEGVSAAERRFRTQLGAYPFVVLPRFFRTFAVQAGLAVMTETLTRAMQDLVHFAVYFISVLCFTGLAFVHLFGRDLSDFSTIFRAWHTCFLMTFMQWDWSQMEVVRRALAIVLFVIFSFITVLMLLNLLSAIILSHYREAKRRRTSLGAVSALAQLAEMCRRRGKYREGELVRHRDIYIAFLRLHHFNEKEMLKSSRMLTPAQMVKVVRRLKIEQAEQSLKAAVTFHAKVSTKPFEVEDLYSRAQDDVGIEKPCTLERLEEATRKVRDGLMYIQDRVSYYDTVFTGADRGFRDEAKAMARAAAESAEAAVDSAVSEEVVEFVGAEVGRLNVETAGILGQTLRRVDLRQRHIEKRQEDMVAAIREMHQTLLNLQSEGASLANRLQRVDHDRLHAPKVSAWRQTLVGGAVVSFFGNCDIDAQEGAMPRMHHLSG